MPENNRKTSARLFCLGGFLLAILIFYIVTLYQTQIVKGSEYLEQSVRTIAVSETVEASRGMIKDRNGQTLVSNRQTYNLTFDPSLLSGDDDENECILRLLQLCRDHQLTWSDELPVSASEPYSYTLDESNATQKNRFIKFLQNQNLVSADISSDNVSVEMLESAGLTAPKLIEQMRESYKIPADWSETDARSVLGVLYGLTVRQIINTTAYIMVEDIDSAMVALLNDGGYTGARVTSSTVRKYETDYAAHILGTVGRITREDLDSMKDTSSYNGNDWLGRTGVESAFEKYLHGTDGTRVVSTNSDGKITSELYSKQPKPGDTVELTIDLNLQQATEDALSETVRRMTASDGITRGAGAAVVQVGTGDILALASYPTFQLSSYNADYNELSKKSGKPLINRATSGTYPPGSTFKPCTATAALESGAITPYSTITTTGTFRYPGTDFKLHCWIYPGSHGTINVSQALTDSCNCFFCELGYRVGIKTLDEYATAYGLGQHTGIEIGDSAGVLAGPEHSKAVGATWVDGNTVQAAIGQSDNLFTPLQLSNYIATLVDGGKRYSAHLLKTVKTYDNSQVVYSESGQLVNDMKISDSTLTAIKKGMYDLTSTGELSSYFKSCVVDAGAKTGTAQLGGNVKNNGIFVCFAPFDKPQIAVAIVIEKGTAGANLASTAVKILNAYFTADEVGTTIIGENQLLN
jgi:penicillin-binding protein 2